MKTNKKPLHLVLPDPTVSAWEKAKLAPGKTLKEMEGQVKTLWCFMVVGVLVLLSECLIIWWERYSISPRPLIILFVFGALPIMVFIPWAQTQINKRRKWLSLFEDDAKELGIARRSNDGIANIQHDTEEMLISAAESVLLAESPFKLELRMIPEQGVTFGQTVLNCRSRYKRLLELAKSFGLSDGDKKKHFGPAQERLDKW